MKPGVFAAAVLALLAAAGAAPAQRKTLDVIKNVTLTVEPAKARRGQPVVARVAAEVEPGWHTYPARQTDPEAQSYVTEFDLEAATGPLYFTGEVKTSKPVVKDFPELKVKNVAFLEGQVFWELSATIPAHVQPGEKTVTLPVRLFACDDHTCLNPVDLTLKAKLVVPEEQPVAQEPPAPTKATAATPAPSPPTEASTAGTPANTGLAAFLLTAMFWGLVSLMTPCVFPMIPITVSTFLKGDAGQKANPLKMALVYSGTIIVVLTLSAWLLLSVFRELSVNPYMNLALGGLFVYFALSLFGAYDIQLPSFLTRFTAEREAQGGVAGTVFMALTFSIVSFTCVAPFLGGFSGMAASGQFSAVELALGGLAFATAFAAPFFVLALFPSLLKKLPRSGDWLHRVKVVMGFLELAAALKFFRTAELRLIEPTEYFTYDLVLGAWVAIAAATGLYLLNVFEIGHSSGERAVGVGSVLFALGFLGLGVYLTPALFKGGPEGRQRPAGAVYAWVDSFLLPEVSEPAGAAAAPGKAGPELDWNSDLPKALAEAYKDNKLVFIDFTGVTCTNCKINERSVFPRPEVHDLLKQYRLVSLYTDDVPQKFYPRPVPLAQRRQEGRQNLELQRREFGTEQLPLYAIVKPLPDGKFEKVAVYAEGKINNVGAFVEFLRKPLESNGKQVAGR